MSDPIDIVQLVKNLAKRPRGKACFVLTSDFHQQKEWAAELAERTGSEHLDLLDLFADDDTLADKVSTFSVAELLDFLKNRGNSPVLVISGLEFLKATWSGQSGAVETLASKIETWQNSPCLVFVLQYDKELATREFQRFRQHMFVVDQEETLALR